MKKQLAVVVNNDNQNVNPIKTINAIKSAGFNDVFVQWYDKDYEIDQKTQVLECQKQGLNILFAHLGYQNINDIWTENGDYFVERYKKNILDCANLGIKMVVMHPCSKWQAPGPNELGLNRFKQIVEFAESLDVKVALENTKIHGFIEYLVENIKSDYLGVCFDGGHYHSNFKDDWDISCFKNKVFCVHLHDNDGSSDQHLLPFDGNLDWNEIINKLNEVNYDGPITMELCYKERYLDMSADEFYKQGYLRGLKIAEML